jgi:hypothetical protein
MTGKVCSLRPEEGEMSQAGPGSAAVLEKAKSIGSSPLKVKTQYITGGSLRHSLPTFAFPLTFFLKNTGIDKKILDTHRFFVEKSSHTDFLLKKG